MIHIVKHFGIVNKAKIDVFLEISCPHNQQKSTKCSILVQPQKYKKISVCFQGKPFNTVIQVYARTTDADEAEADQFMKTCKTF